MIRARPKTSVRPCRRIDGYALLLTLLLLVVVTAAAATLCRSSLRASLRAIEAQDELRQRWGATSAQAVLLPKAEDLLSRQGSAKPSLDLSIRLNDQRWRFVISDEQAKVNANSLYRKRGIAQADVSVRALAAQTQSPIHVDLRPRPMRDPDESDEDPPPAFIALDQVISAPPRSLLARRGPQPAIADLLTCWGDGSVNVRRAPRVVLEQVCRPYLSALQISRLIEWRAGGADSQDDLWDEIDRMNIGPAANDALEDLLTDRSTCHTLWTVCPSGKATRYRLAVAGADLSNAPGVIVFEW